MITTSISRFSPSVARNNIISWRSLSILFISTICSWPTSQAYSQAKPTRSTSPSTAVAKPETLTNKGVITMTTAGLTPDIITAKIASSACAFDVSTNSLIALKQAGVSDEVMKAMMSKANGKALSPTKGSLMASTKAPTLEMANHPYLRNKTTGAWSPLEKTTASIKTKATALGYGGVKFMYQIPEEKSPSRLPASDSISFLINAFGAAVPEFVLYQAKPEKGKRAAIGSEYKTFGGMGAGQDNLIFNVIAVGNGLFRLVPTKKLPPGEYFFAGKPVTNGATVDAYAFGVD